MDHYEKLRYTDRNKMLEEYAETHPEASLRDIGGMFKISKQRVGELLSIARKRKNKEAATGEKVTARSEVEVA